LTIVSLDIDCLVHPGRRRNLGNVSPWILLQAAASPDAHEPSAVHVLHALHLVWCLSSHEAFTYLCFSCRSTLS